MEIPGWAAIPGQFVAHQVLPVGIVARPGFKGRGHACGGLRVLGIKRQKPVRQEAVARAVGLVEPGRVARRQPADDRAEAVGPGPVEIGMLGQPCGGGDRVPRPGTRDLRHEPFVHDQRVTLPTGFERSHGLGGVAGAQKRGEPGHLLGHVRARIEQRFGSGAVIAFGHQAERDHAQRPFPGGIGIGAVGALHLHVFVKLREKLGRVVGQGAARGVATGMDGGRVGRGARARNGLGQVILGGQRQDQRAEGRIEPRVARHGAERVEPVRIGGRALEDHLGQRGFRQAPPGLPPVKRV